MKTTAEVESHILMKVADDAEFRDRLIGDPQGTISAEIGREVPEEAIVVIQQMIDSSLEKSSDGSALTKDELAQVVGGNDSDYCEGNDNPEDWVVCFGE